MSLPPDATFFDGTSVKEEKVKIAETHKWLQEFRD
jgi:uncharacterized protein YaiL (DUF2058 family)